MMSALKTRFVPALRERGFAGSFPHFRRRMPGRIDYLMVQFYTAGGSAEAADRVIDAVTAALPDARRVVFDRNWSEKRLFAVIAQNPLDYTGSEEVMQWADTHPRAHVASFTEKN